MLAVVVTVIGVQKPRRRPAPAVLQATLTPLVVPSDPSVLRNPEDRELFLSGLRLAAGEAA